MGGKRVEHMAATEGDQSLPASGSFIMENQSLKVRRRKIKRLKIKLEKP